uniref:Uncharacterized protein n=1 Tax=Meloidogyne javanica TaxID=6303 RepID=A0A915MPJ9_MELJA
DARQYESRGNSNAERWDEEPRRRMDADYTFPAFAKANYCLRCKNTDHSVAYCPDARDNKECKFCRIRGHLVAKCPVLIALWGEENVPSGCWPRDVVARCRFQRIAQPSRECYACKGPHGFHDCPNTEAKNQLTAILERYKKSRFNT